MKQAFRILGSALLCAMLLCAVLLLPGSGAKYIDKEARPIETIYSGPIILKGVEAKADGHSGTTGTNHMRRTRLDISEEQQNVGWYAFIVVGGDGGPGHRDNQNEIFATIGGRGGAVKGFGYFGPGTYWLTAGAAGTYGSLNSPYLHSTISYIGGGQAPYDHPGGGGGASGIFLANDPGGSWSEYPLVIAGGGGGGGGLGSGSSNVNHGGLGGDMLVYNGRVDKDFAIPTTANVETNGSTASTEYGKNFVYNPQWDDRKSVWFLRKVYSGNPVRNVGAFWATTYNDDPRFPINPNPNPMFGLESTGGHSCGGSNSADFYNHNYTIFNHTNTPREGDGNWPYTDRIGTNDRGTGGGLQHGGTNGNDNHGSPTNGLNGAGNNWGDNGNGFRFKDIYFQANGAGVWSYRPTNSNDHRATHIGGHGNNRGGGGGGGYSGGGGGTEGGIGWTHGGGGGGSSFVMDSDYFASRTPGVVINDSVTYQSYLRIGFDDSGSPSDRGLQGKFRNYMQYIEDRVACGLGNLGGVGTAPFDRNAYYNEFATGNNYTIAGRQFNTRAGIVILVYLGPDDPTNPDVEADYYFNF
ncbi:MAG: hypothetical protein FWH26_05910 [Oscillospiraceae bacterium]|nr:hypothetical protein [Oscillospiraceae bacterium]